MSCVSYLLVGASAVLQNLLYVVGESHVEHLVGLVEDGDVDLGEVQVSTVEVVDAATGGRNHDVDTGGEGTGLRVVAYSSVEESDVEVEGLSNLGKL